MLLGDLNRLEFGSQVPALGREDRPAVRHMADK